MNPVDLIGKSGAEIERALKGKASGELKKMIHSLASLEPFFSPEQIAQRRQINPRTVLRLMKEGVIRPAHIPSRGRWRASRRAIEEWDKNTQWQP